MGGAGTTSLADPSAALLATCGSDTVKLFDLTVESGDPCVLSYAPTPGSHVNSVKWNHTNLVVASAGEDKKVSLWRKNGENIGTVPLGSNDAGDNISESISAISFSNKGSRYICSGGSSQIVRIWDLQRKRCIKWLSGHTDTVTGVMYNCKDEHLASISLKGDIILHNLASGARAAELKDPNGQVLRVLDYSRLGRHILVTAGDDGSLHLWDTTARGPKVSWFKQHSAPTTGVCFSPSSDKTIASVGLDKKLYTFDSGSRRPISCTPHEAPFSSLAFRDDGLILAAGTNTGRVVFYDIRGKPQPLTVLRAYGNSEAVTSLCWQRSKPVVVNENCASDIALLGGTGEDSILMPDPLPSAPSSFSGASAVFSRGSSMVSTSGSGLTGPHVSAYEETPLRGQLWPGGSLPRLQASRNSLNLKDDMDVFSPLVDVQPITPSLGNWWDDYDGAKKDGLPSEKKPMSHSSARKFPQSEGNPDVHPISDWRSETVSVQEDAPSTVSQLSDVLLTSSKNELSSVATTEPWGGCMLPEKFNRRRPVSLSRFLPTSSLPSGPIFAGSQDSSIPSGYLTKSSLAGPGFSSSSLENSDLETSDSSSASHLSSVSTSLGVNTQAASTNRDIPGTLSTVLQRRFSTYPERIGTVIGDGLSSAGSPKTKKAGTDVREEHINTLLSTHDSSSSSGTASLPAVNVGATQSQSQTGAAVPADQLQGTSFSLQLVQRTLAESLGSVQMSIHEDVRNLHIELLRQFHMQEMEMASLMGSVLEKLDDLQKEVQFLRRENPQARMLP